MGGSPAQLAYFGLLLCSSCFATSTQFLWAPCWCLLGPFVSISVGFCWGYLLIRSTGPVVQGGERRGGWGTGAKGSESEVVANSAVIFMTRPLSTFAEQGRNHLSPSPRQIRRLLFPRAKKASAKSISGKSLEKKNHKEGRFMG